MHSNKKYMKAIIISVLCVLELSAIFLMCKSSHANSVKLENVNLENNIVKENNKSNFAIMLGDKEGVYTESNDSVWPSNLKYNYNSERSGCIDSNGNELVNVLNYDSNTQMLNLSVNSTAYCYIYFDLDGVAPQEFEFYLGGQSNPDYTNSNAVNVYINYSDNDISHYCVTEENSSNNGEWKEVSSSPINTTFTLSSGDGLKTVYAYTKDLAGNISEQVIDTINLDTEKPTGNTISINSNSTYTQSASVTLTLSSVGATEMCISNTESCDSWEPYSVSKNWTLTSTDGNKTVYVWYKDNAGNISDSVNDSITLDSTGPVISTQPSNSSVTVGNNATFKVVTSSTDGVTYQWQYRSSSSGTWNNASDTGNTTDTLTVSTTLSKSGYQFRCILTDAAGNTTTSNTVTLTVNRIVISTVPTQIGTLTYTGSAQSPSWSNYNSTQLTLGGTTSKTDAGTYSATFTPTTNYEWSDGTTTAKSVNWTIGKAAGSLSLNKSSASININATTTVTVTRAGNGTISISSSDNTVATATLSGTTVTIKGLKKGTATITVSVAAGTNHTAPSSKTISVTVNRIKISTVPSQSGTLTYTGNAQSPSWSNYSSTQLTLGGDTSKTNAGTYTATFTPITNYEWSDGTTTAKSVNWTIGKAAGSLSLSSSSVSINVGASTNVTVTRAGNGTVSASSNNTGVATVSVSGTSVTIKGIASGSATITVSVGAGTNHTAPSNKTISVKVIKPAASYIKDTLKPSGLNTTMEGGLYRFQGTNDTVNNYICFGTSDKETCVNDTDKYMYRIIGINSNGQMKLIKREALNSVMWWWSNQYTDVTWPDSLIKSNINGSSFLSNTTYVPSGWSGKIATTAWKYGDNTNIDVSASNLYTIENGWTDTTSAKIGLMYVHDYYYAYKSGGIVCNSSILPSSICENSWIYLARNDTNAPDVGELTMSRYGAYGTAYAVWYVYNVGVVASTRLDYSYSIRPVFFLTTDVEYVSGSGTLDDPIIIK